MGAGWKMNKRLSEAEAYAATLGDYLAENDVRVNLFIVPPFTALSTVRRALKDSNAHLGAQNMHWERGGPFTGEISPLMLKDLGVGIVELGHSERRAAFGETDFTVNRKVLAALEHSLRPLICIGETGTEREFGVAVESVTRQVKIALKGVPERTVRSVLFAYEPVWAIGESGTPADPAYANGMHETIRRAVAELYDGPVAADVPILYGGSVDLGNLAGFAGQPQVDGLFIGRASWDVTSFIKCIQAFEHARQCAAMQRRDSVAQHSR
ncbi:MAG TPA: triose-phosphate isomerase [bacterium]|nr:triose-phosphate isomerase [bacterium]